MLYNFSPLVSQMGNNKYKSNDDRDIEEESRIIECFYRITERIEEHDVRKQLSTNISNVQPLSKSTK